ncbi:MAG: lysophospholipid acyltransferase family protein [Gammaproteobacteria bacterium]|nr:lysophospholipid acyltransferase family protein [Gammaproteobacteria bacterium]
MSIALRSTCFAAGQIAATIVFAPLVVLSALVPYRLRYRLVVRWTYFNIWWLKQTCRLTHVVEGTDNIPDAPAIVLCKHQSAWETLILQYYFSPQVWVLKKELLMVPFLGWGLAALRPIAIDRSAGRDAMSQVLEQGRQRLASGCWVVVFPEGTRVPPGARRRYKLGGAILAERTGKPVVPVAHNAGLYWPRNSFFKFPGTIRLVIGEPVDSTGKKAAEINAIAERWIESTVDRLLAQASGGGTSSAPADAAEHSRSAEPLD